MTDDKDENNEDDFEVKTENELIDAEEVELEEIEENSAIKIKELKEKLKKCETEKQDYLIGWQRAKADYVNARKEEEQRRENLISYNTENILRELLTLADAFEQAFKNDGFKNLEDRYKKGIEAIHGQLARILEYHKIKSYDCLGEIFDPAKHEAISAENTTETEKDNIVLEEFQKGYIINNKILRPAKVKVGIYKNNQ